MPSFTLDDLTQPVTRQEAQAAIYEVLGIIGVNTTSWKPGSVVRTMIVATSIVLSAYSELQQRIARGGFLELSEGRWLDLVAHYVYDVDRIEATFATGEVVLANSGGGVSSYDPDDLIFANPSNGQTYRNTAPVSIGALEVGIVVPIRATQVGSAASAGIGEITQMTTVVLNVTCTNPSPLAGTDAETDALLRERCHEKLGSLSPMGPWDAYGSAVRNARRTSDGSSVGVTRIRITKDGTGTVRTYVADADGPVSGDAEDVNTDLGACNDAIQRYAAPLAINALTFSASANVLSIDYEVWLYNTSALSDEEIEETINASIGAFIVAQPIGGNVIGADPGKIFVDGLRAAIDDSLPQIFHVVIHDPAADVELAPNEVATVGSTSSTIHQEPPPEGFGGSISL